MATHEFGETDTRNFGIYTPAVSPEQEQAQRLLLQSANRLTMLEIALYRRQDELDTALSEIKQAQKDLEAGKLTVEDVALLLNKWGVAS